MFCPNCGNNCGDANFCPNCGHSLKETVITVSAATHAPDAKDDMMRRYEKYKVKGNKIATIAAIRKNTGMGFDEALNIADDLFSDEIPPAQTWARENQKKAELKASGQVYCPKCLSTSVSANQKGFGFARGALGAAVGLDVGLLAGGIGAKKVVCTCLKCGHQWKAGKK